MMDNKSDSNDAIDYLEKGNSCLESKKFEEAIEYYNKAIALKSDDPTIYNNRGTAYAKLGKYEEAIKDYDKAIALDPTLSVAYLNRGTAYLSLEKYEEAIKDYDKAADLDHNNSTIYLNRGNTYFNLEKYEDAIKDYDKAVDLDHDNSTTYFNRGNAYARWKKHEEAIKDYNAAADLDQNHPEIYFNRGKAYAKLEKYEEAIKDYDKAIALDPDDPDTYCNRGSAYYTLEKYEDAIKDYDKATDLDPDDPEIYLNRGNTYFNLEKYEEAIKDFDEAIKLDQNDPKIYFNRGNTYADLGNYEEAIKDYNKAIEFDPDDPKIYYNRGTTYSKMGKYKEAIKDFNTATNLDPTLSVAYYNRGIAYDKWKKYEEAIENYDTAAKLDPNDPTIYYNRGNAYAKLKKYEEAIEDYKIFITNNCKNNILNSKNNSVAICAIGLISFQLKKYEECNKYLLEYLKLDKTEYTISERIINRIIGESYIHLHNYEKGTDYLIETQKDPIEFLSIYENIKQMYAVTSSLIDKSPNCRFNRIIASINNKELIEAYKEIYLSVLKIIYSLLINDDKEYSFAHYTTRKTASQLILDKSPLRLSSALTTNDPTEGKTLMTYLDIDTLQANPDMNNPEDKNDFQAFIGCFSFNEESLNQFRLYGKENSEEATGVSIVLNNKFFSKDMSLDILPEIQKRDVKEDDEIMIDDHKYPLFRCLYIDPDKKEVVSLGHSDDNEMNNKLKDIGHFLSAIKKKLSDLENKDKDIIENLFLTLRYLVKHAAFKEEQECRIICIKDMNDDAKKGKEEREIYFTEDYSRMYLKYQIIMDNTCLKKVIFGPKAKGFDIFQKALIHEHIECKCEKSKLPFA